MTSNLALRGASLLLAILLWFAIAAEKTSEMGISVPVELQNVPKDLELTGDLVNTVEVRLRASPGMIQRLAPSEVAARVDVRGVGEGERIVHLTSDTIRVPFGISVVKINPAIITLNFELRLQKLVPVRPRLLGRPAKGYEVAEIGCEPAELRITGPKSRVQEVESVFTEPVSVEGAANSVSESVSVGVEDPVLRILDQPRVRVTARIREVEESRTLAGLEVEVRGGRATLRPAAVEVVLSGPASVMARLHASDVRPFVELAALGEGPTGRARVAVELGPGLAGASIVRVVPAEVQVRPRK